MRARSPYSAAAHALVDDEDDLRRILRRFFEIDGYEVTEATSGSDALAAVERRSPDLVLLDT